MSVPQDCAMLTPSTEEVRQALWNTVGPTIAGYKYDLQQIHGQRKLFCPKLQMMFTPPEGSEVFVGRLPRDLFEDELVPAFLRVGPIYEMRVMMNFSGTNRGFAFVMMYDPETAARAVKMLNNCEIRPGQNIGVLLSLNNRRIYIGVLHAECTQLRRNLLFLMKKLTEEVEDVFVHRVRVRNGFISQPQTSFFAVVVYHTHRAAAMARRILIPLKESLFGHDVMVDWADPKLEARRQFFCHK